ncbi:MAG: hypothetical protein KC483_09105 [Nitrosarchaeum sp.]|nr:hypothetical protein [Nitrosarchaeum sp.]MCA9819507.1 hypothetical protein [Nitrosarchaeum sp.]
MRHVELVVFENDSILNEKALSLPIGRVSFRQLGVILTGVLAAMVSYFVTKEIIAPGVVLVVSLGLGMINTKIMTPDQMIKANLMYLIRGTSLRKKPEKIIHSNNDKILTDFKYSTTKNKAEKIPNKKERALSQLIFSQIESFFEKPLKKKQDASHDTTKASNNEKTKSHAVKIRLTPDNMLQVMPTRQDTRNNSNLTDKLLSSLNRSPKNNHIHDKQEKLLNKVTILLDSQGIDDSVIFEKDDGSMNILLDRHSEYDISTVVDGKDTDKIQFE